MKNSKRPQGKHYKAALLWLSQALGFNLEKTKTGNLTSYSLGYLAGASCEGYARVHAPKKDSREILSQILSKWIPCETNGAVVWVMEGREVTMSSDPADLLALFFRIQDDEAMGKMGGYDQGTLEESKRLYYTLLDILSEPVGTIEAPEETPVDVDGYVEGAVMEYTFDDSGVDYEAAYERIRSAYEESGIGGVWGDEDDEVGFTDGYLVSGGE